MVKDILQIIIIIIIIQIIRKLNNFAGYRLRKHLVESLVLSKLDYFDTVYYPLPEFTEMFTTCPASSC